MGRIQVCRWHVWDEGKLERLCAGRVSHHGRDMREAGDSCGAQPSLARDQLISAIGRCAHDDRLQHAVLSDGRGELGRLVVVESAPGLMGVAVDPVERGL